MRIRNHTHALVLALPLLLLTLPGQSSAQDTPWSISFDLGSGLPLAGDVHSGGQGNVLGLPTNVESRSYGDIYSAPFSWAAAVGYAVTPSGELRGRLSYSSASSNALEVGNVAGLSLQAAFDDYTRLGVDLGYRQYLSTTAATVKPFVGASAGFAKVDRLQSTFSVPAAGVVLPNVDFFDSSTVPTIALSGGVQLMMNDWLSVQGGLDLQWHGKLKEIDGLAGTGLESINDESRSWSMPVTAGLTLRF